MAKAKSKSKETAEETSMFFNPGDEMDSEMDSIEKKFSLTTSMLDPTEPRLSTGQLSLDIILGGGIVAGGWYTIFGGEQSCKSTLTTTLIASTMKQKFKGIVVWFDYEGCLTGDTEITVRNSFGEDAGNDRTVPIETYVQTVAHYRCNGELPEYDTFYQTGGAQESASVGGHTGINAVRVKKDKPITRIDLSDGKHLRGFRHPVLVVNEQECLEWKYLEDIQVGDKVVTKNEAA